MKRWSMISLGGFNEIEISHSTGISADSSTSTMAMLQRLYSRVPCLISASRSAFLGLDAQALDENERDQYDEEEDQHRDRRAEAEVEPVDQLVEAEDRDRFGVLGAAGHDEDRVEDAEGLEGAEENRDQDRRLHQRQGDADEALPGGG